MSDFFVIGGLLVKSANRYFSSTDRPQAGDLIMRRTAREKNSLRRCLAVSRLECL